ncbi:TPA: tail fiber assembly protein [Morganella morganii]
MNYYKDNATQAVYAYDDEQLDQVSRLSELESQLQLLEPIKKESELQLQEAEAMIAGLKTQLDTAIANNELSDTIDPLEADINNGSIKLSEMQASHAQISDELDSLNSEYEAIPQAVFEIRENINVMKKMTPKEIDAHINPPVTKEQKIAEAEQKKQYLIAEVTAETEMLRTKLALKRIKPDEEALLIAWLDYLDELEAVDVSTAPDITWPVKP